MQLYLLSTLKGKKIKTPEMYSPVSHPPKDLPTELLEHQLSYGLSSGKFGRGCSLHANGAASPKKCPHLQVCLRAGYPKIVMVFVTDFVSS